MSSDILEISKVSKSFSGVKALNNVSFSVKKGTVHVLCGENGAGKSTLMKIINGIYRPDKGEIRIKGNAVDIRNPHVAREHGIAMIFQELGYVPEMSIEENFFLGEWPSKWGRVSWKQIRRRIDILFAEGDLVYSPTVKMKHLSISQVQNLEIAKAVSKNAEIIIMDEPTSAITNREVNLLFDKIRRLKDTGTSIIYISHKMDEIFQIADEITVMRDGQVIATHPREAITIDTVITMMVGRELSDKYPRGTTQSDTAEIALEVCGLTSQKHFHDINFRASRGEIVGFSGLMGAGRTELMRAVFGLDHFDSGTVKLHGKAVRIKNISHSISNGMAMLTEDRRKHGIIPVRSIRENTSLSSLDIIFNKGFLHKKIEYTIVNKVCKKMNLNTKDYEKTINKLSGGNQQKVILARWMLLDPDILIMDEPTRGIDVGAKYEIYKIMNQLAKKGKTIIFISSELPELIGMSDRIYVMAGGRIQGELARSAFSQEAIMKLAVKSGPEE